MYLDFFLSLLETCEFLIICLRALLRLGSKFTRLRLELHDEVRLTFSLEAVLGHLDGIFALDATILLVDEQVTLLETTRGLLGGAVYDFSAGTNSFSKHNFILYTEENILEGASLPDNLHHPMVL